MAHNENPVPLTTFEVAFLWGLLAIQDADRSLLQAMAKTAQRDPSMADEIDPCHALRMRLLIHHKAEKTDPGMDMDLGLDEWAHDSIPRLYQPAVKFESKTRRQRYAAFLDETVHMIEENGAIIVPEVVRLPQDRIDAPLNENDAQYIRDMGTLHIESLKHFMDIERNGADIAKRNHKIKRYESKYGSKPDLSPN